MDHRSMAPIGPGSQGSGTPWWGKALIGCGVGCAVLGIIIVAAVGLGVWWSVTPGAQTDTRSVVPPDAFAVVRLSGGEQAQPACELAGRFLAAQQRRQRARMADDVPASMRWLEGFIKMQEQQSAAGLSMWLPRDATLALVASDGERPDAMLAANFKGFVRPIRLMLESAAREQAARRADGREMLEMDNGAALAFTGGTLVWSTSAATLDDALERLEAGTHEPLPLAGRLPDRPASLLVIETSKAGVVLGVLEAVFPDQVFDADLEQRLAAAEGLALNVALPSADRLVVDATVLPAAAQDPADVAATLQRALGAIENRLREHASVDWSVAPAGDTITANIAISGLVGAVERAAERWAERTDEAARERPPAEAPEQ